MANTPNPNNRPIVFSDLLKPMADGQAFNAAYRMTETQREECQRFEQAAYGTISNLLGGMKAAAEAMAYAQNELTPDTYQNLAWLFSELSEQAFTLTIARDEANLRLQKDALTRAQHRGAGK